MLMPEVLWKALTRESCPIIHLNEDGDHTRTFFASGGVEVSDLRPRMLTPNLGKKHPGRLDWILTISCPRTDHVSASQSPMSDWRFNEDQLKDLWSCLANDHGGLLWSQIPFLVLRPGTENPLYGKFGSEHWSGFMPVPPNEQHATMMPTVTVNLEVTCWSRSEAPLSSL